MPQKPIFTLCSGVLAVLFAVYVLLDTFVISDVYAVVESPSQSVVGDTNTVSQSSTVSTADSTENATSEVETDTSRSAVVTDNTYQDENISITITSYRENESDIYVADITLSSAEYLKTALAHSSYGKNVTDTTSNIADENNAILAINGDYYGVQESGYVIRNGVLYRSTAKQGQQDLVIYQDGTMECITEGEISAQALLDAGAVNVLSFGPALLTGGEIAVSTTDEVDKAMTSNPRTAIGVIDDLHYVFVVADGRTTQSAGLSLYQLAEFMQGLGVKTAYNLDGGGSSTMVFNGTVINNPTSGSGRHGKSRSSSGTSERSVSDIVYIGY